MPNYTQNQFIANWNLIAEKLSDNTYYENLPRLSNDGICCGLSFSLAEYVRLGNAQRFHYLYQLICDTKPRNLAKAFNLLSEEFKLARKYRQLKEAENKIIKLQQDDKFKGFEKDIEKSLKIIKEKLIELARKQKEHAKLRRNLFPQLSQTDYNEIVDFVFKIYILQKKQYYSQINLEDQAKTEQEQLQNDNVFSANHLRIGTIVSYDAKNVGKFCDSPDVEWPRCFTEEMPKAIEAQIGNNESLVFSIFGVTGDESGHAVLLYCSDNKENNKYHVFDPNVGRVVSVDSTEDAASEIIYCANDIYIDRPTAFQRLWESSQLFKVLSIICIPITLPWLLYDIFSQSAKDKRSQAPLTKDVVISFGKVSKKPETHEMNSAPPVPDSTSKQYQAYDPSMNVDLNAKELTLPDLMVAVTRTSQYRNNRYFGVRWLNNNNKDDKTRLTAILYSQTDQDRFEMAQQYAKDFPNTPFTDALFHTLPALDEMRQRKIKR